MSRPVAVVTGAGSGIGRHVTHALLDDGYAVVLAGRRARGARGDDARAARRATRRSPSRPTSPTRPPSTRSSTRPRRASGASTCCSTTPGRSAARAPFEDYAHEDWRTLVDTNLSGAFYCAQARLPGDEGAGPARRPDHQQRLDLGPRPAPPRGRLHGDQARDHGPHAADRARGPRARHRLRADRRRQRGDRDDRGDGARRASRPTARSRPRRRWTRPTSRGAVVYMASLPLDANVLFMTVMANRMPFVGRG